MATIYWVQNATYPVTGVAPTKVATGTAIKTLLQIATPSTERIKVVEWGVSFDTPASASIIAVELVQTNVAASTGTAITPQSYEDANNPPSLCVGGTGATCFSPSVEGSTTVSRYGDLQLIVPPFNYVKQWPLGREFGVPVSAFLRVRVTASVTCNAYAYVIWEE
jgi:hypothetical protein